MFLYDTVTVDGVECVVVPKVDFARLVMAAEADDALEICETCGAFLDINDPCRASADDYTGCWSIAAGEDSSRCRSYRGDAMREAKADSYDQIVAAANAILTREGRNG